jgi:hypothetical protein
MCRPFALDEYRALEARAKPFVCHLSQIHREFSPKTVATRKSRAAGPQRRPAVEERPDDPILGRA